MRRLPPNKIEQSVSGLLNLIPQETDEILQRVDQPLEEAVDPDSVLHLLLYDHMYISCCAMTFDTFLHPGKEISLV